MKTNITKSDFKDNEFQDQSSSPKKPVSAEKEDSHVVISDDDLSGGGNTTPRCQQHHAACRNPNEDMSICTKALNHAGQHTCGQCGWNF